MAFDTFLQFTGGNDIKGESTAKGFEGQIEIYSFSLGASNPVTIGSGSTGLFSACCSGQHFPSALVTLRKATGVSGGQAAFLTYTFEDVMVESIQWSGSTGGDDTPTESISIAFGKISIVYSMQDDDTGAMSPKGNASWDQTTVSTGS
jgi:type VI secretion system secreted protein Hcp